MPPESSRQGQKLLLSLIGAVCAFLATRKIMFHSKKEKEIRKKIRIGKHLDETLQEKKQRKEKAILYKKKTEIRKE